MRGRCTCADDEIIAQRCKLIGFEDFYVLSLFVAERLGGYLNDFVWCHHSLSSLLPEFVVLGLLV